MLNLWITLAHSRYAVYQLSLLAQQPMLTKNVYNNSNLCFQVADSLPSQKNASSTVTTKCSLCWDERKNTACTPCGHLFCWHCILQWLQTKYECPLCRESVQPSRIVPLLNYEWSKSNWIPKNLLQMCKDFFSVTVLMQIDCFLFSMLVFV